MRFFETAMGKCNKEVWAKYFILAHNKSCDVKQENLPIPEEIFKIQEVVCHV